MQLQGLTLNLRQTSSTCLPCMMHAHSAADPTKPLALCRSGLCLSGSIGTEVPVVDSRTYYAEKYYSRKDSGGLIPSLLLVLVHVTRLIQFCDDEPGSPSEWGLYVTHHTAEEFTQNLPPPGPSQSLVSSSIRGTVSVRGPGLLTSSVTSDWTAVAKGHMGRTTVVVDSSWGIRGYITCMQVIHRLTWYRR